MNEDSARPESPECRIKQAGTATLGIPASYRTKSGGDFWAHLLVRLSLEIRVFANKSRRSKPGRAHEKDASQSAASRAYESYLRAVKARRRERDEGEAASLGLPIKHEFSEEEEDDDDVVVTSSRTREC